MKNENKIRGAFIGLYFGAGVNPRFSPMLTPEEAKKRFSDKKFDQYYDYEIYNYPYKLYDQHTQTKIIFEILLKYGKITPEIFRDYLLDLHKQYDVFQGDVYGPSTQKAINAILAGDDIYTMGKKGITCGSAMRALPIGIYFNNDLNALVENTVASCVISHNTDVAIEAALITNITLANLLQGKSKFDAITQAVEFLEKNHGKYGEKTNEPKIHERVKIALQLKGKSLDEASLLIPQEIGVSWFARDTIPGAFANYIISDTPEQSSLLSMMCGGDNQTVPEIACCFLGAEKGPDIFQKEIIEKIEKANNGVKVYEMADKMISKMNL